MAASGSGSADGPRSEEGCAAPQAWQGWGTTPYRCHPWASAQSAEVAARAVLRSTDVVVVTFPKTGTTLLQQICEMLRSDGDTSFPEITERQPWLDFAYDAGQDLDADHARTPRVFKSHVRLTAINPGAKYISVIRDPASTAASLFAFQKLKNPARVGDCADADAFVTGGLFDNPLGTSVFEYYVDLWEARNEPTVKVLCYETLAKAREKHVPFIADFMGLECGDGLLQLVLHNTSKEYMMQHDEKFNDNFLSERTTALGRSANPMTMAPKVTAGNSRLSPHVVEMLEARWREIVTPRTGHDTYQAMASEISAQFL